MSGFVQLNFHQEMTDNMIKDFKNRLKNPYYLFSSKKQTICTYYNLNTTETTFDPGLQTHFANFGHNSPLRFNKINNCFLYGIEGGELNAAVSDFGVEADTIRGDCFTLPNIFEPYPNDYFSINYLDKDLLFKVISVSPERLDNGAVFYKIEYILDQHSWKEGHIDDLVVTSQTMKVQNYGTNRKVLLTEEEIVYEEKTEDAIEILKDYFKSIFYDSKVQTFVFTTDNGASFYDPYLIEFIINNDILSGTEEQYIYVSHRTILSKYFNLEYNHTEFKALENRRMDQCLGFNNRFCAIAVEEPTSLLSQHYEIYYQMTYSKYQQLSTVAEYTVFDTDLIDHISNNEKYTDDNRLIYNIIIDYFNGVESEIIDINKAIEKMDIINNKDTFYLIPIILFILNRNLSVAIENVDT